MANARFVYRNFVLESGVVFSNTVGSWLSVRPLTFLISPWRKKMARSTTSVTNVDIVIDLGVIRSFNSAFLINPKIHTGGNVEIQANSTNVWTAPSFTSVFPAIDTTRKLTGQYFALQSVRWVRVLFRNIATVNEYVELGNLVLGSYFEPEHTLTDDFHRTRNDPSVLVKAYDGERQSHRLTKFDSIDGFLEAQSEADKETFLAMYDFAGQDTPVVFSVDASFLNQTYYAYFPEAVTADYHRGSVNLWDVNVRLEEAR